VTILRAAPLTPIARALLLLLSLALGLGCFNLPKVMPGNRILDDFDEVDGGLEDAGLVPTWSAFTRWTCGSFVSGSQEGQDGGQDGGIGGDVDAGQLASPDGGPSVSCGVGPHGEGTPSSNQALVATFDVVAPTGSDLFGLVVTTTTSPGSTVDLTGFTELLFDAELYSTTVAEAMLPSGTRLEVELGCSTNRMEMTIDQSVTITTEALHWPPIPPLPLEMFTSTPTCLAAVHSVSFKVLLGRAMAGTPIAGTLQLDNIAFK
jgi:hypothetical protein